MAKTTATLDFKTCKIGDIMGWCVANDKVEWLKAATANRPSYFTLKKSFFQTFMPDAIPVKKVKKNMFDLINAL